MDFLILEKVHRMNKVLSIVDKLIGIYELLILWFGCYLLQSGLNIYLTLFLMAIYSYFLLVNRDKYS